MRREIFKDLATLGVFAAAGALMACTSAAPRIAVLGNARSAIERTEYDGATQLASAPLQIAQSKLAKAETATKSRDGHEQQGLPVAAACGRAGDS
jgi:hypothetical protein